MTRITPFQYLLSLIKNRKNPLHTSYLDGKRVLDVGCGSGDFVSKDPQNRIGVDLDPELVRHCKQVRNLDVREMSALDLRFPEHSFEAVHAAELIEHFPPSEAVQFLSQAAKILKPGGILYLTTPGESSIWNTFSHIKAYPPIAFQKLLSSQTEGFVRAGALPLVMECHYAFTSSSRSMIWTGLKRTLNLIFHPGNPTGYVIILKKTESE